MCLWHIFKYSILTPLVLLLRIYVYLHAFAFSHSQCCTARASFLIYHWVWTTKAYRKIRLQKNNECCLTVQINSFFHPGDNLKRRFFVFCFVNKSKWRQLNERTAQQRIHKNARKGGNKAGCYLYKFFFVLYIFKHFVTFTNLDFLVLLFDILYLVFVQDFNRFIYLFLNFP